MKNIWFVVFLSLGGFVLCEVVYKVVVALSPGTSQFLSFPSTLSSVTPLQQPHYASSSAGLFIDINGGVRYPGIYHLPPTSRVKDAIVRAGGFSQDVDAVFILQRLNLVEKLHDAEKIYIPRRGESIHLPFLYSYGNDAKISTTTTKRKKKSPKIKSSAAF